MEERIAQPGAEPKRFSRLAKEGSQDMDQKSLQPFHLAIPVRDLGAAEAFYGGVMGCEQGRRSRDWIDFNFFGHQLVVHLSPAESSETARNIVDGKQVPVRHFGVVLAVPAWKALAKRLEGAGCAFLIEPCLRHEGEPGEQHTMFLLDPSGNALEFKAMTNPENLFAS